MHDFVRNMISSFVNKVVQLNIEIILFPFVSKIIVTIINVNQVLLQLFSLVCSTSIILS